MINDNQVKIDGYHLIIKDRNNNSRGGGVCLYVCHSITYSERCNFISDSIEATWIELSLKSNKVIVGCLYRPPNSDLSYFNSMLDIFEKVTSEDKDVVLLGDLNYDYILDILLLSS